MKMKKLLTITMVIILGLSVTACSTKEPTTEPTTKATATETETETAESSEAAAEPKIEMDLSDDIYSYQVQLNGVVYSLPALYTEFAANGWTADGFDTNTLNPNSKTLGNPAQMGEQTVSLTMYNPDVNVLTYDKCYVCTVSMSDYYAKTGASLVLPKGITIGSKETDVIAAYGEPSNFYEGTTSKSLIYSTEAYCSIKFDIEVTDGQVAGITVQNITKPETLTAVIPSGDIPDVVKSYVAPADLGESWNSFCAKYAGDDYSIPAPVAAFANNGWKLLDEDVIVPAMSSRVGISLQKDNQVLRTILENYSDTAQPAANCFVTVIKYGMNQTKLPIELAKGITENSTMDDVLTAFGEPDDTEESTMFDSYIYGQIWEKVTISFDKETGKISLIEVSHTPKTPN